MNKIQSMILDSVYYNVNLDNLDKVNVFSYLFYQLCWDFNFDCYVKFLNESSFNYMDIKNDDIDLLYGGINECPRQNCRN